MGVEEGRFEWLVGGEGKREGGQNLCWISLLFFFIYVNIIIMN